MPEFENYPVNDETQQLSALSRNSSPLGQFLDRPLPSSPDSERVMLGSIIIDNDMIDVARTVIGFEDFYSPLNRTLFKVMTKLRDEGRVIDPIVIGAEINRIGDVAIFGGVATITQLTYGLPHFDQQSIIEYAKEILDASLSRTLIKTCNQIISETLAGEDKIKMILEQSETRLARIVSRSVNERAGEREGFVPMLEIVPAMAEQFSKFNQGVTSGISTGMPEIDEKLDGGGLQNKATYLVAGQEKSGKTSLALDWAYDIAINQGENVLIVTAEMMKETLAKRIYSSHLGIPFHLFRPGFKGDAYRKAMNGLEEFGKFPIKISDKLRSVPKLARHFRKEVEKGSRRGQKPVRLGVIDYLQLIELDNGKAEGDAQAIEQLSREFKKLATELDIPIVLMSSLNRLGLSEGQRADTHNLRGSQGLAFDAEAVFIVHNPSYIPGKKYEPKAVTDIDLILARQRNGPTGDIPMKFIGQFMQFMTASQFEKYIGSTGGQTYEQQQERQQQSQELDDLWQ